MSAIITYPGQGRGAWPTNGAGGTLNTDGTAPGRYYRSVAAGTSLGTVGLNGYRADKGNLKCSVDDYAVWRAVAGIQTELRQMGHLAPDTVADGLYGRLTGQGVATFQKANGLVADGVYGPATSRALWEPVARSTAVDVDPAHANQLTPILVGTLNWESGWDPGAVGATTPQDLGLAQINGPAHPELSADQRLDPRTAISMAAGLIAANLRYFGYRTDAAIAAYNLGRAGASRWLLDGSPDIWGARDVRSYIDHILNP